ncbi:hypothetical protein AHAS_Ahas13G0327500 [Arachis hypogaea]
MPVGATAIVLVASPSFAVDLNRDNWDACDIGDHHSFCELVVVMVGSPHLIVVSADDLFLATWQHHQVDSTQRHTYISPIIEECTITLQDMAYHLRLCTNGDLVGGVPKKFPDAPRATDLGLGGGATGSYATMAVEGKKEELFHQDDMAEKEDAVDSY